LPTVYEWLINKKNNVFCLVQKIKLSLRKIGQPEIADALLSISDITDATEYIGREIYRFAEINVVKNVKIQFRIESVVEYRLAVFLFMP